VLVKNLFDRFSGGQFFQNQLYGNALACDYRLRIITPGFGRHHLSVIAHMTLFKPAYRVARAK
jgi:hypothetical protein